MDLDSAARNNPLLHGRSLHARGQYRAAYEAFAQAITLNPAELDAYRGAADAAKAAANQAQVGGRPRQADELRRIAALNLLYLGNCLHPSAAEPILREAAALSPKDPAIAKALADALSGQLLPTDAEKAYRRAAFLDPQNPSAQSARAAELFILGRLDECKAARAKAVRLGQQWDHSWLMQMHYQDDVTAEQVFAAHRDWGAAHIRQHMPFARNDRSARIRVGYVSADFRLHPVCYFFEPLLCAHDAKAVETFCYSDTHLEDPISDRLRHLAHHWRQTSGMSDDMLRRQVRVDGIDVLIDLSGHTTPNRMLFFAEKPAPVTATWLGYPGTTGLPSIDYRITDALADPPGAESLHTESLVRLPHGFLCYQPPEGVPPTAPLPALRDGHVTFGTFNNPLKVTPSTVRVWSRILQAVPRSRLLLKGRYLNDAAVRARYLSLFTANGIGQERIELRSQKGVALFDHLMAYGEIDIALDPFPYNGATTTCEALWMGVPVVSLIGDRHAARVGLSILSAAGVDRFAAENEDRYLQIAVELSQDLRGLADIRSTLRARLRASPLCDGQRFARDFEAALRQMLRS